MAVIQPRPTHILYQCAKFGNDRTSFNVIFDVTGMWRGEVFAISDCLVVSPINAQ